jgi:hypothetical protein
MSIEDFKELLRAYIGERTDDETLVLLEAMDRLEVGTSGSAEIDELRAELEAMTNACEEVEREWRARYRDRFFGIGTDENENVDENGNEDENENEAMSASEAGKLWLEENGKRYR